ncbi:3-oxo-5-alpha-steroid 4-dehydrogenase family protein [Aspergillus homomorphus CBS 101889]|uniref:Uncharacterized protein n=1 Tax=Aspergillus homomorphus (strain CBS 101889) TaxID=1450537 RepID=A0A395HNJ7_ASPHC|nr:hypothetical protein BO97DRAFT_480315 [Aspergillus homomorphus CBS 101889]RAL09003.1 hypothetical protein BO97DRAFT_480315 [Aspergillus homomorphus CBS 101889]
MGAIISSCWANLPPLTDILLPTPEVYRTLLNIFQYFPLFTTIQWLTAWHPAGKTSLKRSIFNLPGRWAWFAMEITSPLNLLYILWKLPSKLDLPESYSLPWQNKLLAALFVAHYLNRAVISPFLAAPSMSPIHLFIMTSAMLFNWFNSTCLACWLVGYEIPTIPAYHHAYRPSGTGAATIQSLGVLIFLGGMATNIYAERTLFRLRREEAARRAASSSSSSPEANSRSQSDRKGEPPSTSKVYILPPKSHPLFSAILYPHYLAEWIEWTGFALAGTMVRSISSVGWGGLAAATASSARAAPLRLAPWLLPFAKGAAYAGLSVPVPAVVFVVNAVTNMLPHARWGRRWYQVWRWREVFVPYNTIFSCDD